MSKIITINTLLSVIFFTVLISGCNENKATDDNINANVTDLPSGQSTQNEKKELVKMADEKQSSELIKIKGQILFQEMEGGFFGFVADNGKKYTPTGLAKEHLRHGLIIEMTGQPLPDIITFTQFGDVIKVESVIVLDESKAAEPERPIINKLDL
jgi:hypothetical protein